MTQSSGVRSSGPKSPSVRQEVPAPVIGNVATAKVDQVDATTDVDTSRFERGCARTASQEEIDRALDAGPPKYFRSYEQVKAAATDLAAKFPHVVKMEDVGDSGEKRAGKADRDIFALRLGTPAPGQPKKPVLMIIAGEHAREIANPEVAMRFATQLAEGYGKDPHSSILDRCEIVIVPMVNPDGHAVVEQGYAERNQRMLMKRKNTMGGPDGTDINRNYGEEGNPKSKWGGVGASTHPLNETYRGSGPASEAETQAVIALAKHLMPELGFFISLHSYSELVLFPPGDTKEKGPDHKGYVAISNAMADITGEGGDRYKPQQSYDLYPTTGTSDDHIYATLGVPGITIESGSSFHQNDSEFEETCAEVIPVLYYAAAITGAAYARAEGPITRGVSVNGNQVTAKVSDAYNGGQNIVAAEAVSDPATVFGQGVPLNPKDGAWNSATEEVVGDVSALKGPVIYVRAKDDQGNWGILDAAFKPTDDPCEVIESVV